MAGFLTPISVSVTVLYAVSTWAIAPLLLGPVRYNRYSKVKWAWPRPQRIARPMRWYTFCIDEGSSHWTTRVTSRLSTPSPYASVAIRIRGDLYLFEGNPNWVASLCLSRVAISEKNRATQSIALAGYDSYFIQIRINTQALLMSLIESIKITVFGISKGLSACTGNRYWRSSILFTGIRMLLLWIYISRRSSEVLMVVVLVLKPQRSLIISRVFVSNVAEAPKRGIPSGSRTQSTPKAKYSGRKSCYSDTRCSSSIATRHKFKK